MSKYIEIIPDDVSKQYNVKDIQIEFYKGFKKECDDIQINLWYNFQPIVKGCFLPETFFIRKDSLTYIKLKGKDLWLHKENNKLVFDVIQEKEFLSYRQPAFFWIDYASEGSFYLYQFKGHGLDALTEHVYNKESNKRYLHYDENKNKKITVYLSSDKDDATLFEYEPVNWNQFSWNGLTQKPTF